MDQSKQRRRPRKWTEERVLEEINKLPDHSPKKVQKRQLSLYGAAIREFGSWKQAIEASGRVYLPTRKGKAPGFWTRDKIQDFIKTLPRLNSNYVRRHHTDLYSAALRLFGSWKAAIEASDLDYEKIRKR